jgi:hypothetical protein
MEVNGRGGLRWIKVSSGELLAGAAKIDITPPIDTVTQYGETVEIDLPLYTKALVLNNGKDAVAISTNDIIFIDRETVVEARKIVESRTGIAGKNILFCASHTHEGPVTYQGTKPDYLIERVSEAVCRAWGNMVKAKIGSAKGKVVGVGINRRSPYGPIDSDVGVIKVERVNGSPIAILLNFACHGVVLGHRNYHGISPDYPGHATKGIEDLLGGDVIALFANGACANINPYTSVGYTGFTNMGGKVEDAERIGRLLALEAVIVADQIQTTKDVRLVAASRMRRLGAEDHQSPRKRFDALIDERTHELDLLMDKKAPKERIEKMEKDIKYLKEYYGVLLETEKRAKYLNLDAGVENPERSEVQVIGINDIRLAGVPGENFTEYGLYIKDRALSRGYGNVLIAELANGGWWGYVPTEVAFEELGYEALNAMVFAGLSVKSGQIIADTVLELIEECGESMDPPPKPFIKRPLPNNTAYAIQPLSNSRLDRLQETLSYHHEERTRRLENIHDL